MSESDSTLLYVADPMCSWCWGFAPVLAEVEAHLAQGAGVRYVMGGLAPDSDEPMPAALRTYVQRAWVAVAERTGARFDHAFWERNEPRRSTYPACRAVLAAERLRPGAGPAMFAAIQRAYYLEARNPSLPETLAALAGELAPPLDATAFAESLASPEVEALLQADFELRDRLRLSGFPALGLRRGDALQLVSSGWLPAGEVLARLGDLSPDFLRTSRPPVD